MPGTRLGAVAPESAERLDPTVERLVTSVTAILAAAQQMALALAALEADVAVTADAG